MKVKHLVKILSKLNPDDEVIMSKDAWGSSFYPLAGMETDCTYVPETSYSGDIYTTIDTVEDNGKNVNSSAVVLYPIRGILNE